MNLWSEVDFATTARPEDILRLAAQAGLKTAPTGIGHGTVTIIVKGAPFEVTTLRRDVVTDGRRATVAFGEDWAEDAKRRDFTMNALYADSDGRVYDPLGGLPDLAGGAASASSATPLSASGKTIYASCAFSGSAPSMRKANSTATASPHLSRRIGLFRLSRERVRAELLRILAARRAGQALEVMDESGLSCLFLAAWRGGGVRTGPRHRRSARGAARSYLSPRGARPVHERGRRASFREASPVVAGS